MLPPFSVASTAPQTPMNKGLQSRCGRVEANAHTHHQTVTCDTGKNIDDEASHLIAKLVDNHPYYAQQLAQLSWLRTKDVCTVEIVREAHTALMEQLSLLFVTITETLTTHN